MLKFQFEGVGKYIYRKFKSLKSFGFEEIDLFIVSLILDNSTLSHRNSD